MHTERRGYTFLHMLLVGAIALVVNLLAFYALEVVKPAPRYENFCTEDLTLRTYNTEDSCTTAGGQWTSTPISEISNVQDTKGISAGYCNATYTCEKTYQKANEEHSGLAFVVLTVFGGILFIFGMTLQGSSVVSNGLGLGGLISILWGSIVNWSYLYPLVKVGLLAALLIVIIWFAWSKFKD